MYIYTCIYLYVYPKEEIKALKVGSLGVGDEQSPTHTDNICILPQHTHRSYAFSHTFKHTHVNIYVYIYIRGGRYIHVTMFRYWMIHRA